MKNMIKLSAFAVALMASASVFAAGTALTAASRSQVTSGTAGACPALQEDITVKLSANVSGAFECSTVNVAISTANAKGRGRGYTVHSGGGAPAESNNGAKFADQAAATTYAASLTTAALARAATTSGD